MNKKISIEPLDVNNWFEIIKETNTEYMRSLKLEG